MIFENLKGRSKEKTEQWYGTVQETRNALREELQKLDSVLPRTEKVPRDKQGEIREALSEGERRLGNLNMLLGDPLVKEHVVGSRDSRASSLKASANEAASVLARVRRLNAEAKKYLG